MDEIAGDNTVLLGGYLHSSKKGGRWAEGFHDEFNGHVIDLERGGLRQVVLTICHTGSVSTRVNKDRAFRRPPGGGVTHATGALSKIRGRDNITIGAWNTRTLRAAGKL